MRLGSGAPLAVLLARLVVMPAGAAADEPPKPPSNDDCLACHGDASAVRADGRSVAVAAATFSSSVHGQAGLACVDCHADLATVADYPHAAPLARVACVTCHEDAGRQYDRGVHAEARRASRQSVAATCGDCHGTHDIRPARDPESHTYHLNLPQTCGRCHGDDETIKRGRIAIGNVYALYEDSIHGQALSKSGLLVAPNCADCHGNHDIRRRTDPAARIYRAAIPATCGTCHEGVRHQYEAGIHGRALAAGNARAPVCADCHTAHQIRRVDVDAWRLDVIRECGTCHTESIRTYRDTFHGQVTALGFTRVAACADCHGAHEIHPKADPRSTVSDARRLGTCRTCHPAANGNFARYDPHADTHDRARNPTLFYAARFMKGLLTGVFAFFGLHTVLWIPRAARARRELRRPRPVARPPSEPDEENSRDGT